MAKFVIKARGHRNVKATHKTTFEITKDDYLTERGTCIIGINADKAARDLPEELKRYLKEGGEIKIILRCGGVKDVVVARGSPDLTFKSERSIVIRKSNYIDDRTVAIKASKGARDLKRELIDLLKEERELEVIIEY